MKFEKHTLFEIKYFKCCPQLEAGWLECATERVYEIENAHCHNIAHATKDSVSKPNVFLQDPFFSVIKDAFVDSLATISSVEKLAINVSRSWLVLARNNELLLFDLIDMQRIELPSSHSGLHNHVPFTYTGVFYLLTPKYKDPGNFNSTSGKLQFLNPLNSFPDQPDWFNYAPSAGDLIVFPSGINHRISPLVDSEVRISISMDGVIIN